MNVAVVGAPLSGKTQLTRMLIAALQQQSVMLEVVDAPELPSLRPKDLVLLCGLDLSPPSSVDVQIDQAIRHTLTQAGVTYQVVYGQEAQRLDNALFCIAHLAPVLGKWLERPEPPVRWSGSCETCGNGACEHRLFTGLLKS